MTVAHLLSNGFSFANVQFSKDQIFYWEINQLTYTKLIDFWTQHICEIFIFKYNEVYCCKNPLESIGKFSKADCFFLFLGLSHLVINSFPR